MRWCVRVRWLRCANLSTNGGSSETEGPAPGPSDFSADEDSPSGFVLATRPLKFFSEDMPEVVELEITRPGCFAGLRDAEVLARVEVGVA